ncbi:MAG TPA: ribonuclease Z [Edaphocola sp.]|nr:ribonuclease Z [Edaphocola sp.]
MEITILGNNSAIPSHGRNPTAQTVAIRDHLLLLDCGEGTQMQMIKYSIKRSKIGHIFISHLHGDHFFGLIGLINSFGLLGRTDPLHIFCPEALPEIIQLQLDAAKGRMPFEIIFYPIKDSGERRILVDHKDFKVSCFPVNHKIPTHGFLIHEKRKPRQLNIKVCLELNVPKSYYGKLQDGEDYLKEDGTTIKNELLTLEGKGDKTYAFCADTIFTDSFIEDIKHANYIYHESTYLESEKLLATQRYHSTASQAAQIALKAQVGHLLLGHYSSRYLNISEFESQARVIFPNTIATKEGDKIEF